MSYRDPAPLCGAFMSKYMFVRPSAALFMSNVRGQARCATHKKRCGRIADKQPSTVWIGHFPGIILWVATHSSRFIMSSLWVESWNSAMSFLCAGIGGFLFFMSYRRTLYEWISGLKPPLRTIWWSYMMIIYEDSQPKRYKVIFRLIFNRFQQFLWQIRCNDGPDSIIGVPGPRV